MLASLLVGAAALATTMSCSCDRNQAGKPADQVTITAKTGWQTLGADPVRMEQTAGAARQSGRSDVADSLLFYADSARANNDLVSVVTTPGSAALVAVQRHLDSDTPLDTAVQRLVDETKAQDVTVSAHEEQFHGVRAWRVDFPTDTPGRQSTTFWFDAGGGRYTVDVTGAAADTAALAEAVVIK